MNICTQIFCGITVIFLTTCSPTYNDYTIENTGETNPQDGGNEDSMTHAAKTATGRIISKTPPGGGPSIQDSFESPTVYTVQFSITGKRPFPAGSDGNINPVATIKWSLGGNTITRKISAFTGASITGLCENVNVKVDDETSLLDASQQQEYDATILAASGTRAGNFVPPTYQIYQPSTAGVIVRLGASLIAGGTFVDVNVPTDAGVVSVLSTALIFGGATPLVDGDVLITQFNSVGGQLKEYNANIPIFVPVSPQVTLIRITNTTGSIVLVSLTWGIDG